jgi:hypothetical protein
MYFSFQRRFDVRPIPSATCPRESVLPIRPRPDFFVVFEGYAGGAEHRCRRQVARKPSLRANILRTSRPRNFGAEPVSAWIERDALRPQFCTSILGPFARRVINRTGASSRGPSSPQLLVS